MAAAPYARNPTLNPAAAGSAYSEDGGAIERQDAAFDPGVIDEFTVHGEAPATKKVAVDDNCQAYAEGTAAFLAGVLLAFLFGMMIAVVVVIRCDMVVADLFDGRDGPGSMHGGRSGRQRVPRQRHNGQQAKQNQHFQECDSQYAHA